MPQYKISIITVVYNNAIGLAKTIKSIRRQTYSNIEYIVIDGGSQDTTLDVIKENLEIIAFWKSEPDRGLYDAMNKGLAAATGDYVCFLNSGDKFYSNDTLEKGLGSLSYFPDILYGETIIISPNDEEIGLRRLKAPEHLTWRSFQNGMVVCHQSVYVKRSIASTYDLKYKFAADYHWVLKALKKAQTIENTHLILTHFLDGGISKKNIRKGLIERLKVMIAYYGLFPTLLNHLVIGVKFFRFWIKNKRF